MFSFILIVVFFVFYFLNFMCLSTNSPKRGEKGYFVIQSYQKQ